MNINKSELQTNLELLLSCSSASTNEDVSDKVMFHEDGMANASRGRLFTYLKGEFDFEGIFPLDNFLKIVKAMSGDEINISFVDDELKISSLTKTKLALKPLPIDNFKDKYITKAMQYISDKEFKPLPKNFITGLKTVVPCALNEKAVTILCNVAVGTKQLIASDNYKIGQFKLSKSFPTGFMIDTYNVQPIIDFNPTAYCLCDDRILFSNGNNYQMCAINSGKYPDFTPIFNRKSDMVIKLPDEVKESVALAQLIPGKDEKRQMEVSIGKNKLALSCKTIGGWYKKNIRVDYSGTPIIFRMNLNVMDDMLKNIGTEVHLSSEGTGMVKMENFNYIFPIEISAGE